MQLQEKQFEISVVVKFGDWITSYLANCLLGIISTLKTGREEWKTMHLSS